MSDINYIAVGEKIKNRRVLKHITQAQLAEICDVSVSHIAYIEGGRKGLSVETAVNICNALDMSLDYLFLDEIHDNERILTAVEQELKTRPQKEVNRFVKLATLLVNNIDKI